jgi:hypothetical protein
MKKDPFGTARSRVLLALLTCVSLAPGAHAVAARGAKSPGAAASSAVSVPDTPVAVAQPAPALPAPSELEAKYGLQIAQVVLAASGGLVDVRFRVLDAAKVKALLDNPSNAPVLLAGDKPPLQPPHHALRGARYAKGQVFYILYPNVRSTVKPGAEVTVGLGEARLGPVTAQ